MVHGRRPGGSLGGSGCCCRIGAARTPGSDGLLGTIGDGTAAPPAHPRPPAGPSPQSIRIGTAADLLRVPAAAADRDGAVPRSNSSAAKTAALRAGAGPAAGPTAGRERLRSLGRGGADAGTPERDTRPSTMRAIFPVAHSVIRPVSI